MRSACSPGSALAGAPAGGDVILLADIEDEPGSGLGLVDAVGDDANATGGDA